jgi:hypothetical protein
MHRACSLPNRVHIRFEDPLGMALLAFLKFSVHLWRLGAW